jgi:hypothetical protein
LPKAVSKIGRLQGDDWDLVMLEELAQWVTTQRSRLASRGKPQASYAVLSRDILLKTGHEVTNESLRSWELKLLKTNPSPAKLQVIVDYAAAISQDRPDWIPIAGSALTLTQVIQWLESAQLHLVALMVSRGIERLEKSPHRELVSPQVAKMPIHVPGRKLCEMITASGKSAEAIAALASIDPSRLRQIMDGSADTQLGELALLAAVLTPNGDVDAIVAAYEPNP